MSETNYTPTTAQVREAYSYSGEGTDFRRVQAAQAIDFDTWLAKHDAEVRKNTGIDIAARIRQNCTPPSDAYDKGGDVLIYAVASWIENPPEWVKASWA